MQIKTEEQLALEYLDKAKIMLICRPDSVFICHVLFNLRFAWDYSVSTACTDGVSLIVNPKFFVDLTPEERIFLLAHEAWHVAFMHVLRVENRQFPVWNMATDYVINDMLINSGFSMPQGGLYDPQYQGMSSDEVYNHLIQNPNKQPTNPNDMKEVEGTPDKVNKLKNELTNVIFQAAIKAEKSNQAGAIPSEILRRLEELRNPELPWFKILSKYLTEFTKSDYTYRKVNRRFFPKHILPSLYSQGIENIPVFGDTSGSISKEELNEVFSELVGILYQLKPEKISFIGFDTRLNLPIEIKSKTDVITLEVKGGGGTNIKPVYQWVKENKPKFVIVFTDGYFQYCLDELPSKTTFIWIIKNNPKFNVKGKIIHYKPRKKS